jgi:hypothetical protein
MAHIFQRTGGKSVDLDSLQLADGRKARGVDRDVQLFSLSRVCAKVKPGSSGTGGYLGQQVDRDRLFEGEEKWYEACKRQSEESNYVPACLQVGQEFSDYANQLLRYPGYHLYLETLIPIESVETPE